MCRIPLIILIFLLSFNHFSVALSTKGSTSTSSAKPSVGKKAGSGGGFRTGMAILGAVESYNETGDMQILLGDGAQIAGMEIASTNCPSAIPLCVLGMAVVAGGMKLSKKGQDTKDYGRDHFDGGGNTKEGEVFLNGRSGDDGGSGGDDGGDGDDGDGDNEPNEDPNFPHFSSPNMNDLADACASYNYSCEISPSGNLKSITTPDNKTIHTPFERDDFVDAGLGEEYDAQSDQIEAYKEQINDYMKSQLNENQPSSLSDNSNIDSNDDFLLDNAGYDDISISRDVISPPQSGRSFSDSDDDDVDNFFKNFFKNDNKKKDRSIQNTQPKQVGLDKVGSADGNIFEQVSRSYANFKNI